MPAIRALLPFLAIAQPNGPDPRGIAAKPKRLDHCKHFVYKIAVIRSFADAETERFWTAGRSRRLPSDILKRAKMRMLQLDAALRLDDLKMPPSNRLEALKGDRRGRHSIRFNDQWRLCFRFAGGDAFDVEIADYH